MALRLWMKLRLKCRFVVAFLFLFSLSVAIIYTLPPFQSEQIRVNVRGPRNNKPSKLLEKWSLRPYRNLPGKSLKNPEMKDSAKHLLMFSHFHQSFSSGKIAEGKASTKKPSSKQYMKNANKNPIKPFQGSAKRAQAVRLRNSSSSNTTIHLLRSRHDPAFPQPASIRSLRPNYKTCRHKCTPDGDKVERIVGHFSDAQQVVKLKQAPREAGTHERQAGPSERKRPKFKRESINSIPAEAGINDWCKTFTETWNQTKAESLPWFSADDIKKMALLSRGNVLSKARLPGHGQVVQVGLSDKNDTFASAGHLKRCQTESCALIKRPNDWSEVFAFHLDRVLGLNRSLPAVLRAFHSEILPYQYTSGTPRPVVWWDPSIQHLSDAENDQNSFSLTWPQYQALLKSRCGIQVPQNFTTCVGVHHSEWGQLALFDFLLQVRKTEPSKLVFIDNAGRPHQPHDNLNFRLVEGIDEFPEKAVSILQSGCLKKMLLHSLSVDREFWLSRGEASGLKSLIQHTEQRAKALLRHIQEKNLRLNRDL
ncbi:Golgi-associated kinase 1A isoform X2 [Danio aesculapii]|uniref:Golgi-associated kinase 1A isoform X2 n=1 Tax=Danio aesculapii TaxID=1142201 RepID=UPI0024C08C28|nr:Golgi-associated kinase 1A isoform X2 [Danio aesculapii]